MFSNHFVIDEHGMRLEETSHAYTRRYSRNTLPTGEVVLKEVPA